MAYDDLTKQILKHKYGDAVKTEVKVGDLEKSFDILLKGNQFYNLLFYTDLSLNSMNIT